MRTTSAPRPSLPTRRAVGLGLLLPSALAACGRAAGSTAAMADDQSLGDPKAKITVVEYASVGCPVCGKWAREVFPAFKRKYIDTGRVRFTYREMLVGGGVEVTAAAAGFVLARCAGPDKYFPVIEAIYRDQDALFQSPRPVLQGVARGVGLDEARFTACMGDDKAFTALNARTEANARSGGVDSTPTFVVNGRKLDAGFQPLTALDAAVARG